MNGSSTSLVNCYSGSFHFINKGPHLINLIINIIFNTIIGLFSTVVNTFVLVTICKNRNLQTPANILLANGAISDTALSIGFLLSWNIYLSFSTMRVEICWLLYMYRSIVAVSGGVSLAIVFFNSYRSLPGHIQAVLVSCTRSTK